MNAYQRYYQRNREAITARLRDSYDPEAKRAYYEEHKEHIKEKMKEIYQRNKAQRNKSLLEERLKTADDALRSVLTRVIENEAYKTMGVAEVRAITAI